jgi:peroxiredoxin
MRKLGLVVWVLAFATITARGAVADDPAQPPPPAKEVLTIGEPLPDFESKDELGQPWKLSARSKDKILVLYFYPGDFTGGCIRQAQAFREGLKQLEALDVEVVGVSGDEGTTHQLFKQTYDLKHTLLADSEGALAEKLGLQVQKRGGRTPARNLEGKPVLDSEGVQIHVERKVTLPRSTLIVGRDGKLVSNRARVNPATDAEEVRKIVEALPK